MGYLTNWIALKGIFEPVNPIKLGPFTLQGMFMKRQPEVSAEFSQFISTNILNSQRVWQSIIDGPNVGKLKEIIGSNVPLSDWQISRVVNTLRDKMVNISDHPIHSYTDKTLGLESTLIEKLNTLSPAEFERILHPIF